MSLLSRTMERAQSAWDLKPLGGGRQDHQLQAELHPPVVGYVKAHRKSRKPGQGGGSVSKMPDSV